MMTGPAVGPAMLLTVLMRWPSLIVIGTASVTGTLIYRELDDRYELTEQIQALYKEPHKAKAGDHPRHGDIMVVRAPVAPAATPTVIPTYPMPSPRHSPEVAAEAEPAKKPVEDPAEPPPVQVASALALDKPVEKAKPSYSAKQQYVVQKGDSLSKIVTKLGVPPPKRNNVMQDVFSGNQRAFMDNDPDRLSEGTVLNIPQMASK